MPGAIMARRRASWTGPTRNVRRWLSILLALRPKRRSRKILSHRTLLTLRVGPVELARRLAMIAPGIGLHHAASTTKPPPFTRPAAMQAPTARSKYGGGAPSHGSGRAGSPRRSNGAEPCRRDRACRTSGKQGARPLPGPAFYSIKASGSRPVFGRPASPPGPMLSS